MSSRLDRLAKQLTEATERANPGSKFAKDERLWACTTDKAGNGRAVLRFLPEVEGEDCPYIQRWEYYFKGPTGKFYVANSLQTLGQADPVDELRRKLWDQGDDASAAVKKLRGEMKAKMYVYTNALVVKDPGNRDNEGKVVLYRFGKKILDKVTRKCVPGDPDLPRVDVFDPVEGCDFHLIQARVSDGKGGPGFPNYDASEWGPVRSIADIYPRVKKLQYPLAPLLAPDQFPASYAEAKKKLEEVMGAGTSDDEPVDDDLVLADDDLGLAADASTSDDFTNFADLGRRV